MQRREESEGYLRREGVGPIIALETLAERVSLKPILGGTINV